VQAAREDELGYTLEAEPSELSIIIDQRIRIVWFLVLIIVILTIALIKTCFSNSTKQVHAIDANKPTPTADDITPNPDYANSPKSFPQKLNYGGGSNHSHSRKASVGSMRSEGSKQPSYRGSQHSRGSSGVKYVKKRNGHVRAETESSMINTLEQTGLHINS